MSELDLEFWDNGYTPPREPEVVPPPPTKITYGPYPRELKITASDIKNKTGWIVNENEKEEEVDYAAEKVGFGKFRDLTLRELREGQPQYFMWASMNIVSFTQKVNKVKIWQK